MAKFFENKFVVIILSSLLILGVFFFWYSVRPSFIIKNCYKQAEAAYIAPVGRMAQTEAITENKNVLNYNKSTFNNCLVKKGLKSE